MRHRFCLPILAVLMVCSSINAHAQPKGLTTIIFDLGGVVVGDSTVGQVEFFADLLHIPVETVRATLAEGFAPVTDGRMSEEAALTVYAARLGGTVPPDWRERVIAHYLRTAPLRHEMLELVHCLQLNGYRTPLLSDTSPLHAQINRERGAYDAFQPLLLSHETHRRKPATDTFLYALQTIGVRAEECAFVDDRQRNVDGAHRVGIEGIRFDSVDGLKHRLTQLGVNVVCPTAR